MTTFPNGPAAKAECTSPTWPGRRPATWGRYLSEDFSLESSSSDTTNKVIDDNLIVTETTNNVFRAQGRTAVDRLGAQLAEGGVQAVGRADRLLPDRAHRHQRRAEQQRRSAAPGSSWPARGSPAATSRKQFNSQVKGGQSAFKTLGKYGLRILEPRVGYSRSQRYVVEISALDGMLGFAARQNQIGQGFGFRLGVSRSAGRYERQGVQGRTTGYEYMDDPTFGFY